MRTVLGKIGGPVLALLLAAFPAAGEEPGGTVAIGNEAIRLVVNATDDGRGRFAVDVTGGDPERTADDGQPLIYGRPIPWTSYTTVRVDGRDYAFGSATARRSGKGLAVGEEIHPPAVDREAIVTAWRFGDVEVTQHLSIVEGPTTGALDTARIAYTLVNRGSVPRQVGLRVCLDTMLGENDGAPFRLGTQQILTDTSLAASEAEPYWQAFDSLEEPRVIAQGSLDGGELTPPDRIYFTNWGTAADAPWEPPLVPGRDFTRLGEFEPDSAVVLLWREVTLPPGGTATRVTYYGLGGVTIARGLLALGLTAPASVNAGAGNTFMILAYLENRGEGVARDAAIALDLPGSLRPLSPVRVSLGRLRPGECRQVAWMVEATGAGTARIRATAEAFGLEPVAVERTIRLVAPARIEIATPATEVGLAADRYDPYPVSLTAVVANKGGAPAAGVWAQIAPSSGLELAPGEGAYRWIGPLGPGEETKVSWYVVCGGAAGTAGYKVLAGGGGHPAVEASGAVQWPPLPRKLRVKTTADDGRPGWHCIELSLVNLPEAASFALRIGLPEDYRLAAVQRGGFLVDGGNVLSWRRPPVPDSGGLVLEAARPNAVGRSEEVLALLWLVGEAGAVPRIKLEILSLQDESGKPLSVNVTYEDA